MRDTRIAVQADPITRTDRVTYATQFEYPTAATLTKHEVCACIDDTGVIPALSAASIEEALFIADALIGAGIPILEISMNAPDALDIVNVRNSWSSSMKNATG